MTGQRVEEASIMAERLDELLQAAAPRVTDRTPQLEAMLDEIVLATATAARPRRDRLRSRAVVMTAGLAVTIGAGVTAAAAAGVFSSPKPEAPDWFSEVGALKLPIVLSDGEACEVTYAPVPDESATVSPERWQAALDAAQAFVAGLDARSLGELSALGRSDSARVSAVSAELAELVQADLRSRGLPAESIIIASFHTCTVGEE